MNRGDQHEVPEISMDDMYMEMKRRRKGGKNVDEDDEIDFEDEIVNGSMLLNKGEVNHPMLQKFMEEKS